MFNDDLTQHVKSGSEQSVLRKGGGLLKKEDPLTENVLSEYEILENVSKASLQRIEVILLPRQKPDFDFPGVSKDAVIAEWLKEWITEGLDKGSLNEDLLLPKKADIAKYLGVSIGTVQNAIRYIEDDGFVESKQRIGTMIKDPNNNKVRIRKLTSKRDQAVIAIKKLIIDRHIQPAQALPSAREIGKLIGSAPNTTRLALEFLASHGIVESRGTRGNKANWYLEAVPTMSENEAVKAIVSDTLIDQVERDLKGLIASRFKVGDKLPSHLELANVLKVSIKTVHDAMCRVIEQGIVQSHRGRYGSYVMRIPATDKLFTPETAASIFVPAQEALFYNYSKVEKHLKSVIAKDYKAGDKLPSMNQLADTLGVSSNTVRKALQNLGKEDIVRFERGRYGGTFVAKVPEVKKEDKSFQWVSINPETMKTYQRKTITMETPTK